MTVWLVILLCAGITVSRGTVRRVPEEYATIQSAFNVLEEGDTVLVSLGTYAEALEAPPLHFTLRGNVEPDTGVYPRPTIDPSSLANPDLLSCLVLPQGSHPVIEDIRFRNGPEMFPRPANRIGGIVSHSQDPVLRRCVFDSVYVGFFWNHVDLPPCSAVMEHCLFRDDSGGCAIVVPGRLLATDCVFTGSGFALVQCGDQSSLVRCTMRNGSDNQLLTHLLLGYGRGIEVRDCIFGPYGPFPFAMVEIKYSGALIEGNLFVDNHCATALRVQGFCHDDSIVFEPFVIGDNGFLRNAPAMGQSFGGVGVGCDSEAVFHVAEIENNTFVECSSYVKPKAIAMGNGGIIGSNRFTRLVPPEYGTMYIYDAQAITLRNNLIWETSYALRNWDLNQEELDARWNYWGDSTGPYHATLNPEGQGDEIQGNVLFDPWYPDTSFLSVRGIHAPLPETFELSAYPNPFNSSVTLSLVPSQVAIVRVELFDILGRRVQEIWSGPLAYEKRLSFDGSHLSSGIYFVRVRQPIGNRALAMEKIVLLK